MHAKLWKEVDGAIDAFFQDLHEHNAADDTIMLIWTEFGRRVKENGSGTDHGAGGVAFVIGEHVKGGQYGAFPSCGPRTSPSSARGCSAICATATIFAASTRPLSIAGSGSMAPPLLGASLSNWPSSKGGQYEHEYRLPLRAYHSPLAQTGRGFSLPVDCALGPEGVLYVLNRGTPTQRNTHVTICTVDGEYRTDFGSYGAGDGQFIWPTAIVVDREVSTSALRANTASRSLARRASYQQVGHAGRRRR